MTEKLYEQDAYLRRFSARVERCTQGKRGWEILLDRTAFYPEGGGQPWDRGTLGTARVLEVHSRQGEILHLCDAPLEAGSPVEGEIDWERRFDLMQNHSGEHIVSGLAHALWGCENVGFHMGAESITVDLDRELSQEQLEELEGRVNAYLWEDHPVEILYPSPQELEHLAYRSKKALEGQVRIVTFPGADCCACCGTHVASSGQVGLVKFLSAQRFREGIRLELLCGKRAWGLLKSIWGQNLRVSHLLSAKMGATAQAVERLQGEAEALKSQLFTLRERRFAALAEEYRGQETALHFEPDLSPDALRRLCDALLHTVRGRCACFSGSEETGYLYALGEQGGDLRDLVKELNRSLRGRGGGKPDFAQGSVQAGREEIIAFFREHIESR